MNETSPWRALEDQPAVDADSGHGTARSASGTVRGSWVLAALAVAAVAAGAAIWIAIAGSRGSVVVEGGGALPGRPGGSADPVLAAAPTASAGTRSLVVDVQGAVVRPGIVHLPAGSRVADAIAAAGGYGPRVAAERLGAALNLAAVVRDGDQVVVPSRDDPAGNRGGGGGGSGAAGGGASGAAAASGPLDLNRATATELDALPGIGPVTAAKIVAARGEQAFASVDDLKTRKILGAAAFDKIRDLVVVR